MYKKDIWYQTTNNKAQYLKIIKFGRTKGDRTFCVVALNESGEMYIPTNAVGTLDEMKQYIQGLGAK